MLGPSDGKQQLHSHLCLQSFSSVRVQREGPAVALGWSLSLEPAGITLPRYYVCFTWNPSFYFWAYAYMSSCLILKEWETRDHSSAYNVH